MEKLILVPTDFTKVSDTALEHAILVASTIGAKIQVLHIVDNKKVLGEVKLKLSALKDRVYQERQLHIHTGVRIGNIFEDIDKAALEMDADLIIMGSHGARGLQFLKGSRALKLVTESEVPFIVVQERAIRANGYQKILVPLDLHKETKQKLSVVADMANYFGSQVHLISPGETDEFLKNQLDRNITFAKQYLDDRKVKYEVQITQNKSSDFVKDLLKYAAGIDADLICIMNFYGGSFMSVFSSNEEQHIITNESQIPVLCVNPVETFISERGVFVP